MCDRGERLVVQPGQPEVYVPVTENAYKRNRLSGNVVHVNSPCMLPCREKWTPAQNNLKKT